jgi:hypothetical protein
MKSRFTLLALMVVTASPLAAQGFRGGFGGRGGITNLDAMKSTLKLSSDQKKQYQDALTAYNKVVEPLQAYIRDQRQAGAAVPTDSTRKQQDALNSFATTVDGFLTETQKPVFDSVAAFSGVRRPAARGSADTSARSPAGAGGAGGGR